MSELFELHAESRAQQGKGASRRLRGTGKVPAILYGGSKEPQSISLEHRELAHHLESEAFYSHVLNIIMEGGTEKAILKDLQRHPARPFILHVDLLRVTEDQEIRVHVPLHFINEDTAPGVKQEGGAVSHLMTEVEVACLPRHLPEFIELDLAGLHLNDSIHLSEIRLPEGVTLTALTSGGDHDQSVVSIHPTRASEADSEDEESTEE